MATDYAMHPPPPEGYVRQEELKMVLDREAATAARHDARVAALEARAERAEKALRTLVLQRDAHFHTRDAWDEARAIVEAKP